MNPLHVLKGPPPANWHPRLQLEFGSSLPATRMKLRADAPACLDEFYYVAENVLPKDSCENLIQCFSQQAAVPVGVDGYGDADPRPSAIGSYRANAWSESLGHQMSLILNHSLRLDQTFTTAPGRPVPARDYKLLGSTPFLRFMKYPSGGRHVPHYDASFISDHYLTLMSWVLYLNTPRGFGGAFQFIDDGQSAIDPADRTRSDWRRMASEAEILASISPRQGRLLIFPHWLPHQVELFNGQGDEWRMIIRGDVAYGW